MKRTAAELGLPFGERTKTYNSRLAQEAGKWAETQGKGDAFHHTVFKAYFVDGRNIGQIDTLTEMAMSVGLPAKAIKRVLESRTFKDAVDKDWFRSQTLGVTAVPTFRLNRQFLVGAQKYEKLVKFLEFNRVNRRSRVV